MSLLFGGKFLCAQSGQTSQLSETSISGVSILDRAHAQDWSNDIDAGWRAHEGDDLAWATPDFDDSTWNSVPLDGLGGVKAWLALVPPAHQAQ